MWYRRNTDCADSYWLNSLETVHVFSFFRHKRQCHFSSHLKSINICKNLFVEFLLYEKAVRLRFPVQCDWKKEIIWKMQNCWMRSRAFFRFRGSVVPASRINTMILRAKRFYRSIHSKKEEFVRPCHRLFRRNAAWESLLIFSLQLWLRVNWNAEAAPSRSRCCLLFINETWNKC